MKVKYVIISVILLLISNLTYGQNPTLTIGCTAPVANSFDGRPNGQGHVYVAVIAPYANCGFSGASCRFKWEVTNGKIVGALPTSPGQLEADQLNAITVQWNNVNSPGKVKVTSSASSITGCSDCPGLTAEKDINIKYLGTPGSIKVNGVTQSGSVSVSCVGTNITLSVDPVTNATNYQWVTPWGNYNGQTVSVTTTANLSGGIRVLASRSDVPSFTTNSELFNVYRETPKLDELEAAQAVFCNTSQSLNVTATSEYYPPYGSDAFIWTTTGGVKVNGQSGTIITSNASTGEVHATISATSDGTYSVRAYNSVCGVSSDNVETRNVYFGPPALSSGWYETNGLTYGLAESEDPPYPNAFCYTGPSSPAISKVNYLRATGTTWTKISSTPANMPWAPNQYGGLDVTFKAVNQQGLFSVNYSNICGNTTKFFGFRSISCSQALTIFPNPSTQNTITIELENVENEDVMPQSIALFSERSTSPVKTVSAIDVFKRKLFKDDNKIEIDTHGLAKGVYYLHIVHGKMVNKEKEKIRLLIE
ncbi:T9SS type A sorting domain-containing protein [Dyadobacter sp. CY261]|uniref:T9SS type A sorting domain-containing protein n=1 Tax=Dyadobacter sp. CY261 TaxID=2907203 RepID=UPI001F187709|nr:T9SS type A sorting domain-containing protein [Dyadobacter sp. CY261]MCF0075218.1 T9SS type A sorting domain-containing protein [Dyadobacter sp. CY261]